jgi:hypothetical protein
MATHAYLGYKLKPSTGARDGARNKDSVGPCRSWLEVATGEGLRERE